jgi:hypothetical protein
VETAAPAVTPSSTPPVSAARQMIEAATANDVATLASLVRFTPTACATNVQGAGGPPDCRAGEADGTLVDVLAISDCEGHFVREDELALDPIATGTVTFVDAFAAPQQFFPQAETVLVFTRLMSGIGEIGWELAVADDAIVGIKYGCGETAAELIEFQGLGEAIAVE